MTFGIVVHGGAGDIESHEHAARLEAVRAAVRAALPGLQQGGSALDAVHIAVLSMEDHPLLNAGFGSKPNRDGVVEMDAMIMDGRTHLIGAVGCVQRIKNPISLAREVMEDTKHHLLVGTGAEAFAREQGFQLVDPASMIPTPEDIASIGGIGDAASDTASDTVGAVALDSSGNVAIAVSTGGIAGKMPGRVGDSPIAGAGGYADNALGAACATGVGEGIMRALLTFRAVEEMAGEDAQAAAQLALDIFTHRFQGQGGLIAIDRHGHIGIAHNTRVMPVAYSTGDEIIAKIARK